MDLAVLHDQPDTARVGDAHAHAGVLHGAGQAHVAVGVHVGLYGLQRFHETGGLVYDLSVGQLLAGADGVAVADLPGGDADQVGHLIQQAFDAETGLRDAEAAEGAGGRIVGVIGPAVDLEVLIVIRTGGVGAGALQDGAAQRGVSAGVGNDFRSHALDDAVFVAAQAELHLHGMALGMDENAFRAGQLDLHGALGQIGDEGGVVLDGDVLLAAEAAANQTVADFYLFGGQTQHSHGLVLGVVGALVGGEDHHTVAVGIGHGALRLQECVFRPGGREALGQHVFALCNGFRRIAALNVLVGQQIAGCVDQRRVGQHGLARGAHHGQLFVVHPHQLLGLRQDLRRFGGHKADGVAQIVGDIAHGDHGVPVFFQMAHLVLPGNIGGGEDCRDAGERFGFFGMDGQHSGPGIGASDGGAVQHAFHVDIVGIDAGAGDFFRHVHAGDPLAQRPVFGHGGDLTGAQKLRRQQDAVNDLHVAGAAADVVADGKGGFFAGGGGVFVQQGLGADDHAGDAESALHGAGFAERICIDVPFKGAETFHGNDRFSFQLVGLGDAGFGGFSVNEDGAGAAGAFAAAVFYAGQMELIPQKADQLLILFHSYGLAVHVKGCHMIPSVSAQQTIKCLWKG